MVYRHIFPIQKIYAWEKKDRKMAGKGITKINTIWIDWWKIMVGMVVNWRKIEVALKDEELEWEHFNINWESVQKDIKEKFKRKYPLSCKAIKSHNWRNKDSSVIDS